MEKDNKYYEKFIDKVYKILKNSGTDRYYHGYCIVEGKEKNSYYIQSLKRSTKTEKYSNIRMMEVFIDNLREHLFNDAPFKIVPKDSNYYISIGFDYDEFFSKLNEYLFDASKDRYSRPIPSKFEQFEKILECFAPIMNSIDNLLNEVGYNVENLDGSFDKYLYSILSVKNNFEYYLEDNDYLASNIEDEISSLGSSYDTCISSYGNDDDNGVKKKKKKFNPKLIKKGLINYFSNRKEYLSKITDQDENLNLFERTKSSLKPEDWKEISSYIVNLNGVNNAEIKEGLVSLSTKPIFQINLNTNNLLTVSQTIVTEKDLFEITEWIVDALHEKRPEGIDYVKSYKLDQGIIIFMSGDKLNQDFANKICVIFEKMIAEYNSDNINKNIYKDEKDIDSNQEYMNKAAEAYWLDAQLESSNNEIKNKKINKL